MHAFAKTNFPFSSLDIRNYTRLAARYDESRMKKIMGTKNQIHFPHASTLIELLDGALRDSHLTV
jgi:hypothetical protein